MPPVILGIGGTLSRASSSEAALRVALRAAADAGARTLCLTARDLILPHYGDPDGRVHPQREALVDALRSADGVIVSSPGYHGGISGLLKNALDHAEDLAGDSPPYLTDMPIGCVAVAQGAQAAHMALRSLRDVAHALRGFPTPYGAALVVAGGHHSDTWVTAEVENALSLVAQQVVRFSALRNAALVG